MRPKTWPDYELHSPLQERFSPRAFADKDIDAQTIRSLFEAARWAPSCFNEQPWSFFVAHRGQQESYEKVFSCINEFNQSWAKNAPLIVISVIKKHFDLDGRENKHAGHDLGLAVAQLTIQAQSAGLSVHQMAGFHPDKAKEVFSIPDGFEALTALAIGYPGDPSQLSGFAEGAWWVQDAAAAMPTRLLGQLDGKQVIDLCAAPGGKTAQLIAAGANVTAIDSNRKRLDRLRRNLKRLNMPAKLVLSDGRNFVPDAAVDAILLDAPCSATGTIRRHPDLPHLKGPGDVAKLVALQETLLARAADWLRPSGRLIFATCSLQPEEGPDRITAFLANRDDFEAVPATVGESGITAEMVTPEGWLRCLPSMEAETGGMDGFFAACLRRIA